MWTVCADQILLFIRMKPNLKYIVMIKQKATIYITEKFLKVAINTITWVWTKSLIMHTVTFRGIVNVEKIYCDFFSCDFFCYLSCDFLSCDFFSVYHLCIAYIISHLLEEMYENQISILLEISCTPMKNYYLHQWFVVVKSVNGQKVTGQKVTKLLGQKVTGQNVIIYIFYPGGQKVTTYIFA